MFPWQGKKWWQNADEPWQALACCMEIANAVRSPDPTHFISHFPVHQVMTLTSNPRPLTVHLDRKGLDRYMQYGHSSILPSEIIGVSFAILHTPRV